MKSIVLLLLGVVFGTFGLAVESVYAEIAGLLGAVVVFSEAVNTALDWHKAKAVLATAVIAIATTLLGYVLNLGFLQGMEIWTLVETIIVVILGALGLWNGFNYKKTVEAFD